MSTNNQQQEGRQTRARSRELGSAPPSPKKPLARARRGKSASAEPKEGVEYAQAAQQHLSMLPTISEDSIAAQLQQATAMAGQTGQPMPQLAPPPSFQGAPAESIKSIRNRKTQKRGPRNQQQQPASTAPIAIMTSEQTTAQSAQQIAQDAHQQMTNVDPQLESAAVQPMPARSLMDRQEDAVRVPFDESQESAYPQAQMQSQEQMDGMPATQDKGFQAGTPNRRQRAPKRPRPNEGEYPPESSLAEETPPSPRRTPPPSNYAQIQQQAKLFTAGLRRDRTPQKRKAWTSEECDALIDGIGQYGNAYATLKAEDQKHRGFLTDRSAEDLRHKARNMKFDYLKAHVTLPTGFDSVLLDKKFQDKLAAMGLDYTQTQIRQTKRAKTKAVPDDGQEKENNEEGSQPQPVQE